MSDALLEPLAPDRLTWVAPFGVQFCDAITLAPIRIGLDVVLKLAAEPQLQIQAHANSSGILLAHRLPGMPARIPGSGDAEFWRHPPASRDYLVEVRDRMGRYLPLSFHTRLPQRGLCLPEVLRSSPPAAQSIPLYSAPSRPRPLPLATLRGELRDAVSNAPVAWALVEAWYQGRMLGRAISDPLGRVLLMFGWPEPEGRVSASPPSPPGGAPLFSWQIELRVCSSGLLPAGAVPDCDLLLSQPQVTALAQLSPPLPLAPLTLEYGRELSLRSDGANCLYLQRA